MTQSLLICERCGGKTGAVVISLQYQAVCMTCLEYLEQPEVKLAVSDVLEVRNIRKVRDYIAGRRE